MWTVVGLTIASVIIFVVGMLLPPAGEVHPSILKGLGIITADITLVVFAYAIVSGKTATFTHGNTTASIGRKKDDDNADGK